jgi:hypothetical protein
MEGNFKKNLKNDLNPRDYFILEFYRNLLRDIVDPNNKERCETFQRYMTQFKVYTVESSKHILKKILQFRVVFLMVVI